MIYYNPTNGNHFTSNLDFKTKAAFIMTKLGEPIPSNLTNIRKELSEKLKEKKIKEFDAESTISGKDFLLKIWKMIIAVPLGIAIISEEMNTQTLENIFYEIGLMQAYGKETLIIKTKKIKVPSDFVRTEYIEYDKNFSSNLNKYFKSFFDLGDYYATVAEQLEKNPLLAIDYLKRAYLITGKRKYRDNAKKTFEASSIEGRAKNSVENLLINF